MTWSRWSAYGLTSEWAALLSEIEDGEGVITEEMEARLKSLTTATEEGLDQAAGAVKAMEAAADELKAEAARLTARARTPAAIADGVREFMGIVMDAAHLKSAKSLRYTVTRTHGRESVKVVNGDAVPQEFWIPQPPTLDKVALGKALKIAPVEGARMERGPDGIMIR